MTLKKRECKTNCKIAKETVYILTTIKKKLLHVHSLRATFNLVLASTVFP